MEWVEIPDLGHVLRRVGGPALLVSPTALAPEMKAMMPEFLRFDSRAWAGALEVPPLVIAGSRDPLLPVRHARAVHEAIAGSHFAEIPGAGHVPLAQRRPEVREAFRRFVEDRLGFGHGQ
jgi:pimeloyl-ACP methyl ester carboxylesterase